MHTATTATTTERKKSRGMNCNPIFPPHFFLCGGEKKDGQISGKKKKKKKYRKDWVGVKKS